VAGAALIRTSKKGNDQMNNDNRASDATVTPEDLLAAVTRIRKEGMGKVAAGLLEREPVLGELIVGRWNKVQAMLCELGLSEEQSRPVLIEVCRLIVEPWVAVERSHRRMWDDFLPAVGEGHDHEGE
jgi:hypothetical protein